LAYSIYKRINGFPLQVGCINAAKIIDAFNAGHRRMQPSGFANSRESWGRENAHDISNHHHAQNGHGRLQMSSLHLFALHLPLKKGKPEPAGAGQLNSRPEQVSASRGVPL
jgi:hypothetical protein